MRKSWKIQLKGVKGRLWKIWAKKWNTLVSFAFTLFGTQSSVYNPLTAAYCSDNWSDIIVTSEKWWRGWGVAHFTLVLVCTGACFESVCCSKNSRRDVCILEQRWLCCFPASLSKCFHTLKTGSFIHSLSQTLPKLPLSQNVQII